MSTLSKRTTVYFDPKLHRALRLKAAETERSFSELVNEAVSIILLEDIEDIEAYQQRKDEADISYEDALKELRDSGLI